MSKVKDIAVNYVHDNTSNIGSPYKTVHNATLVTKNSRGNHELRHQATVSYYTTSSQLRNSSKTGDVVIPRQSRVIDTTRWGRNTGNRTDQPKTYSSTSGKHKPIMYVRSIHPMHIDLRTHVRRKIEEGIDIGVIPINQHPFKYLHSPPECDFGPTSDSFNLLILVKSSNHHVVIRDSIRKSWGNLTNIMNVKVMFLIAYKQSTQTDIDKEATSSSDIIQEDFIDAYKNNTLKTIMGFNWAVEKCSQADLLFFVDDDHIIRIANVMAYLRTFNRNQIKKTYVGFRIEKPQVDRRDGSPWGMSNYDFSHVLWPAYLRGGAFVVSSEIANRFVIAFPYVKLLSVDDSYLGIVADKLGMLPQHDQRFKMDKVNLTVCPDYFVYNDYKTPQEIKSAWKTISLGT
ncbi:beta-1,3-galactosyltransferase brn-like [Ylistrum balloti]|uniref:beta-1,3-galactosyltransferase brn-like n=1 Tax=Ylistrum balloti TaxID=509963 RepID=UPI002905D8CB|nr:beta-1,3-galactosyltransferase brn-like [Ylistrum balloti]